MSVGEVAALLQSLAEVDRMLTSIQQKAETLHVEAGHAVGTLREVEYAFYRVTSVLGRMGLPENIDKALSVLQRLILTVRMLHSAMMFLEMTTPYGIILGVATATGAVITGGSLLTEMK